jgi:polyisoprenoid-binding protein YceI
MKKQFLILLILCGSFGAQSQDIYFTRTGRIDFHAGTSLEDIDAVNNEVASLLNVKTGELVFTVLIKSFHFKRALMEEHFNENYMESNQFPKASYKGKITQPALVKPGSNGTYSVVTEGELTIHGVTRKVTAPAKITVSNGKMTGQATFKILLADYNIQIPGVVAEKISKEAEIQVSCVYEPKQ